MTTQTATPQVSRRGRLLIAGGVYGNWQAFAHLLTIAQTHNIADDNIILTGDLLAYCADGAKVAAHVRQHLASKAIIIRGNCERALAEQLDDCACGFAPDSLCKTLSEAWYEHAKETIDDETKAWMGRLPPRVNLNYAGKQFAIIHGGADADNTFIFASTPDKAAHVKKLASDSGDEIDGVICGHCGIPFTEVIGDNKLWHNSGAVGMPANDGTSRVWCSIWDEAKDGKDGIKIHHHPFEYDYNNTIAAMQAAGLPSAYQKTLANGIFPSDSILPEAEKQQQGQPLALADIDFA